MSKRGLAWAAFATALILLSFALKAILKEPSTPSGSQPGGVEANEVSASREPGVVDKVLEALAAVESRNNLELKRSEGTAASVGKQDQCQWWDGVAPSRRMLSAVFFAGPIRADSLWRHPQLNRADRAPCKPDRDALDKLIASLVSHWDRMHKHYHKTKLTEMESYARTGNVPEWVPVPASEESLTARAGVIQRARRKMNIDQSLDDIVQELRGKNLTERPRESYVQIDGKFYLSKEFPSLPKTRECKEEMRAVATQCGSIIIAFFVQRGYTYWDNDLALALDAI